MIEDSTEEKVAWFQTKIDELKNDMQRKNALSEMKSMVLNSEKKVLQDIVHSVAVKDLLGCLVKCENQDINDLCTIVNELLGEMNATTLLESYGESLHRLLFHPSDEVKGTVLKLLQNNFCEALSSHCTTQNFLTHHESLLVDVTACLACENRSTAQGAISLLIKLGDCVDGLLILYSEPVLKKLKEVMKTSDTARFRVYEVIVSISKLSSENLSRGIASGIMEELLKEISSSDILVQLNALELLSNLASSNHGLSYLQEHAVIQNLVDKLLKLDEEPLSIILLPGLIEFFGNLCASRPENFANEYPQVMDLLFKSIDTNDEVLLGVILTIVGKIGSTQNGRIVLLRYEDQLKGHFFKKVGQILTTKNNLTISAMNCVGELVKDIDGAYNLNVIADEWFQSITPSALDNIVKITKLPFVEFRLAGFALLKAIASQQWGTKKLANYPGLLEFLTDRSSEFNKDCKQMKFDIVCNVVECPNIEKMITQQMLINLKMYVKDGPFHVPTTVEMATEGAE